MTHTESDWYLLVTLKAYDTSSLLHNIEYIIDPIAEAYGIILMCCGDPRARPDPVGESEPEPRGRSVEVINQIPFISVLLNFSFKSVATRNPDLTRLADPSRSLVYSDISIILSKHLVYFIHFKFCKFRGSNSFWQAHKTFTINKRFTTFTFNKMPLQNTDPEFKLFTKCQCSKEME